MRNQSECSRSQLLCREGWALRAGPICELLSEQPGGKAQHIARQPWNTSKPEGRKALGGEGHMGAQGAGARPGAIGCLCPPGTLESSTGHISSSGEDTWAPSGPCGDRWGSKDSVPTAGNWLEISWRPRLTRLWVTLWALGALQPCPGREGSAGGPVLDAGPSAGVPCPAEANTGRGGTSKAGDPQLLLPWNNDFMLSTTKSHSANGCHCPPCLPCRPLAGRGDPPPFTSWQ